MNVSLRKATENDCTMVWEWFNDPVTRKMSRNTQQVSLEDHQKWFLQSLVNPDRSLWIALLDQQAIGVVRFDDLNENLSEISINISPDFRAKGLGSTIIYTATQEYVENLQKPKALILAMVRQGNMASSKSFLKAGYEEAPQHCTKGWDAFVYLQKHPKT